LAGAQAGSADNGVSPDPNIPSGGGGGRISLAVGGGGGTPMSAKNNSFN